MDPILFSIDWPQLSEALAALIILSVVVERSLTLLLENKHVVAILDDRDFKEVPALILSISICYQIDFDVLAIMLQSARSDDFEFIVTAAVIAGGYKASIKLFPNFIGLKSARIDPLIKT